MAATGKRQGEEVKGKSDRKSFKNHKGKRKNEDESRECSSEDKCGDKIFKRNGKHDHFKAKKAFRRSHVENLKTPTNSKHLSKEFRVPAPYRQAARILQHIDEKKGSVKNLVFSMRRDIKKIYAIVLQSLKYKKIILRLLNKSRLLQKEKQLNPYLARVLIYDMMFGRKSLTGESKPIQVVLKHRGDITKALKRIMEEASVKSAEELLNKENITVPTIPHYARVNTLLTTITDVVKALQDNNCHQQQYKKGITLNEFYDLVKNLEQGQFAQDIHFSDLLVFSNRENLSHTELYNNGHIILEDKTSYLAAKALSPPEGSTVLDGCAAPGIKTTHLAALMNNKGKIFACDVNENRMEMLKDMIKFTGVNCCSTLLDDFTHINPNDEQYSPVEYILLDPTCSGSGMVSRLDSLTDDENSKSSERIKKLSTFQTILLKHALQFQKLKRIVYSTCSVNVEENEEVVKEALIGWEETYKVVNVFPDWPTRGKEEYEFGPLCVRSYPDVNFTNGFFIAVIERVEGSTRTKKKKKKVKNTVAVNNKTETPKESFQSHSSEAAAETDKSHEENYSRRKSKKKKLKGDTTVTESVTSDLKHSEEAKPRRNKETTKSNAETDISIPKPTLSKKSGISDTEHMAQKRKLMKLNKIFVRSLEKIFAKIRRKEKVLKTNKLKQCSYFLENYKPNM